MRTLFLLCLLGAAQVASAQRFGYFNSQLILEKMPEYQESQQELEKLTTVWRAEVEKKQIGVDSMKIAFQAEELLMTNEMKRERMERIRKKEDELREYQNNAFGYEGLLFKKQQDLIKPLQDRIFEAVEKVCKKRRLAFMFDKAGDLVMIYTDPRHNYTDYVLEELDLGDPVDTPR